MAADKISQTPVLENGVLFVGDWAGIFYALNAVTGNVVWQTKPHPKWIPPGLESAVKQPYTFSNPVVAGDLVVACTQSGLICGFNKKDGGLVWKRNMPKEVYSSLRFAGGKILLGCKDFNFYALNHRDGSIAWKYECGDIVGSSCAVTKSGRVYFPSHDKHLHVVDLETGKGLKKYNIGYRSTGSPAIHLSSAYMCTTGRRFTCFDLIDGSVRWWRPSLTSHQQGVGVWKGNVYVQIGRYFYCYNANTGEQNWKMDLASGGGVSPCIGRQLVYIADQKGNVYAFDLETGKLGWQIALESGSWSSPVLVDGMIYIGDGLGHVVAIK